MINVRGSVRMKHREAEINMSPLIDLVFLLLIFFMVTTSFVRETGIDVQRPSASTAALTESGNILVAVSNEGEIYFDCINDWSFCGERPVVRTGHFPP